MFSIQTFICKVPHEFKSDKSGTRVFVQQEQKTYKLKQDFNTLSKHVVPEFEFSLQEA